MTDSDKEKLIIWLKSASKEERHIKPVEDFSLQNPEDFKVFHRISSSLITLPMSTSNDEYTKLKGQLYELIDKNETFFQNILSSIK